MVFSVWVQHRNCKDRKRIEPCLKWQLHAFKVTVILHTFLNEGDEVIVPTPNWPNMKWAAWLDSARPASERNQNKREDESSQVDAGQAVVMAGWCSCDAFHALGRSCLKAFARGHCAGGKPVEVPLKNGVLTAEAR